MSATPASRLAYIDWMRGLACVLMFQTHCYDSWLTPAARKSTFFMRSQLLGTLPAPLFLFLSGISFALVMERMRRRGATRNQVARTMIRRGAEILGLGLLFRLQEYAIAFPWAPWTDLLRVDILNTIGVSMMLMGVVCSAAAALFQRANDQESSGASHGILRTASAAVALAISLVTPLIWNAVSWSWLPWPLQSYLNGVHNLGKPQPWLFPIFPWAGFAFAGLAVGFCLVPEWAGRRQALTFLVAGVCGILLIELGRWLDGRPQLYPVYDFWHTSPNFFLIRVGILLTILFGSYCWCRWGPGHWGFSPLIQLGQTSLLVYWVHIEFVYGRLSILRKHEMTIAGASAGLLIIYLSMLVLSLMRTRWKGRAAEVWSWIGWPVRAGAQKAGQ